MENFMHEEEFELTEEEMEFESLLQEMEDRKWNSFDYDETSSPYYQEMK